MTLPVVFLCETQDLTPKTCFPSFSRVIGGFAKSVVQGVGELRGDGKDDLPAGRNVGEGDDDVKPSRATLLDFKFDLSGRAG
jgi:hypothetical protein